MTRSSKITDEIDRLMRDPNALRSEPQSDGRGHYDPTQPRVPAGNSKGGQWAAGGYHGGDSNRDADNAQTPRDDVQLAQLGSGSPRDADAHLRPFEGMLGNIDAAQHLTSQNGFIQAEKDRRTNPRTRVRSFEAGTGGPNNRGRYEFVATEGLGATNNIRGPQLVVSSTTYVYDRLTGAYATIRATPARPIEILEIDGKVYIGSFR
jgi:hypothetical protein